MGTSTFFQTLAAVRCYLPSQAAHHAGDAGAPYARGQQTVARLQKQVAHGAADHATILAEHQPFLNAASSHSARASTWSRRFRCLIPAKDGFSPKTMRT